MINQYTFHFIDLDLEVSEVDGSYLEIKGIENLPYSIVWRAVDFLCKNNYDTPLCSNRVKFYAKSIVVNL